MATPYVERPLTTLPADAATEYFWRAARDGRLVTRVCKHCGQAHWYPRALCPFCLGETEWRSVKGGGTIYSVSVTRRAGPIPYAIAYVTLDEGFTMLSNIVDCDLDQVHIGQRVAVCFKTSESGDAVPMFAPEPAATVSRDPR